MIKYAELGWTKVGAGHYKKDLNGRVLEIKKTSLPKRVGDWWVLYLDGLRCTHSSGEPHRSHDFESAVRDSRRVGPCKDCGKIHGQLLQFTDNSYNRCMKCARFHAELNIGYSEAARVVRRIDGLWEQCDKIRAASSTREAVERYMAGEI